MQLLLYYLRRAAAAKLLLFLRYILWKISNNENEILVPGSIHESESEDEKSEKINENVKHKMKKIISEMQNEKNKREINKKYTFNIKYINTFNYINK